MLKSELVVSVCVITYNQESFIEDAINGILNQECDYKLEVVISNDGSSDATWEKIMSFQNHPKWECLKLINHPKNVGPYLNLISNLEQCTGDFLAFCEGDDYWIDNRKLQKQIDFLRNNQEYSLTFTSRKIEYIDRIEASRFPEKNWSKYDIYKGGAVFPLQTMVGINYKDKLTSFLSFFSDSYGFDKLIGLFYTLQGNVRSIDEIMAVYRFNGLGIWSKYTLEERLILNIDETIKYINIINDNSLDNSINLKNIINGLMDRIIKTNLNNDLKNYTLLYRICKKYNFPIFKLNKIYLLCKLVDIKNRLT